MFDMKKIGERIAALRRAANLTQYDLAARLGLSFQAVSNWERGESMPDLGNLLALAELLGVSTDYLLGGAEPAPRAECGHDGEERAEHLDDEDCGGEFEEDGAEGFPLPESLRKLLSLAPFLESEVLWELLKKRSDQAGDFRELVPFAPFLEQHQLLALMRQYTDGVHDFDVLTKLAAFLDDDQVASAARKIMEEESK